MTFSPLSGFHVSGRFFSRLMPFCSGPRHWYHPGIRAVCGLLVTSTAATVLRSTVFAPLVISADGAGLPLSVGIAPGRIVAEGGSLLPSPAAGAVIGPVAG